MGTVTKTWSFDTDAEGLVDNLESAMTFGYGGDQAVRFSGSGSMATLIESAIGGFDETWYDWGVPYNGEVTHLQITAFSKKVITATNVSAHILSYIDVYTDASTCVTGLNHLVENRSWNASGTDAGYIVQAGGSKLALTTPGAYTDYVALKIHHTVLTNPGTAESVVGYDEIVLDIYYQGGDPTPEPEIDVDDCVHNHICSECTVSALTTIAPGNCIHGHLVESAGDIAADTAIAVADCKHTHTVQNITPSTTFDIVPASCVHACISVGNEIVRRTALPQGLVGSMPTSAGRLVRQVAGKTKLVS
jgi:hypothetical protein